MSSIEYRVCTKITQRANVGKKKYGTTMDRKDLTKLDLAVYLEKIIQEEENDRKEKT